ncbi:hypothetical protein [Saccharothrix algeriensis]|uniref:Uncharacterized protein n=1 Tax=Saccharothrix algeriensis TaxID=173560 RepID=A0A8T8HTN4_9PSEU|nr:hypothetical protein [Saccharothrix algeriensis]MBM7812874.1 hypothetical protein [Saccharothrix algeriensis]QTR01530.1 hypothetical protein J7S33_19340 [Saccharothrix algeriensis]
MEQSWQITGTYADWRLTVDVLPPEGEFSGAPLPAPDFASLAEHFRVVVEMTEAHRELDRITARNGCA